MFIKQYNIICTTHLVIFVSERTVANFPSALNLLMTPLFTIEHYHGIVPRSLTAPRIPHQIHTPIFHSLYLFQLCFASCIGCCSGFFFVQVICNMDGVQKSED